MKPRRIIVDPPLSSHRSPSDTPSTESAVVYQLKHPEIPKQAPRRIYVDTASSPTFSIEGMMGGSSAERKSAKDERQQYQNNIVDAVPKQDTIQKPKYDMEEPLPEPLPVKANFSKLLDQPFCPSDDEAPIDIREFTYLPYESALKQADIDDASEVTESESEFHEDVRNEHVKDNRLEICHTRIRECKYAMLEKNPRSEGSVFIDE